MKFEIRNTLITTYFVLAIVEVLLYALSGLFAGYILIIALASAATSQGLRHRHWWTGVVMWFTFVISFIFGLVTIYASFNLGSPSVPLGIAMIVFTVITVFLPIYATINWSTLLHREEAA